VCLDDLHDEGFIDAIFDPKPMKNHEYIFYRISYGSSASCRGFNSLRHKRPFFYASKAAMKDKVFISSATPCAGMYATWKGALSARQRCFHMATEFLLEKKTCTWSDGQIVWIMAGPSACDREVEWRSDGE
jgi:hypothetical protein